MSFCTNYGTFISANRHVTATLVTIPPDKVSQCRECIKELISKYNGVIRANYTSKNGCVNYKIVIASDGQRSDFINIINQTLSNDDTRNKAC